MTAAGNRGSTRGHGLEVRCRDLGERHLVELDGELDLASADALRTELDGAAGNGRFTVVDLHGLTFIDSTGLGVLFDAFERAQAAGRWIVFTHSSAPVERILRLTGLDRVLPLGGDAVGGGPGPA